SPPARACDDARVRWAGRRVGLFVLAATAIGAPAITYAQAERSVTLDWQAPPECPGSAYVMGEVARQLAGSTASPDKRIRARAEVQKEGAKWNLRLSVEQGDRRGERSLRAESCKAAADATALIVAMAVDPSRALAADAGSAIVMLAPPSTAPT